MTFQDGGDVVPGSSLLIAKNMRQDGKTLKILDAAGSQSLVTFRRSRAGGRALARQVIRRPLCPWCLPLHTALKILHTALKIL